ncbi:hypothetical protein HNQ35_001291 [Cerasibacillus quisquiliarum]|uniref:Uncharacterized protein n=1 Tax=Cerasibacillus quisquiliarum TaxID=227865 RepID=A0A511UZD3_9BACI|nr:hypothetical protein [Cerasibacillus quisquiliarum]MBB5146090.1 hypothetical protein [Cerasibacillus quisquiliarum]GEN30823.1 hypothetical protein CQU01_10610 [Cerasibacillus quisquiliarum]
MLIEYELFKCIAHERIKKLKNETYKKKHPKQKQLKIKSKLKHYDYEEERLRFAHKY